MCVVLAWKTGFCVREIKPWLPSLNVIDTPPPGVSAADGPSPSPLPPPCTVSKSFVMAKAHELYSMILIFACWLLRLQEAELR